MDWNDLRHLLAVAKSGSLTEAARALRTSPATGGRRIAALESALETKLFHRRQTGYSLTESGESICHRAEQAEEAILSVEREALGRDIRVTGKVRVTTSSEIATAWIAPAVPAFRAAYPGIALEVISTPDVVNLTRREADIALRTVRPTQDDYVIRKVAAWNLALYASRKYAKAKGLEQDVSDLSNAEIITFTEEYAHLLGAPWLAEHASGAQVALATNTRQIQYAACRAGVGLAILPCATADREPELIRLVNPERVIQRHLWLVVHRDLVRT